MLKTTVKVSNLNNLSDARYCAGMGVEMLGFSMDELDFEKFKEMRGWLAGVQIVGETDSQDVKKIIELNEQYQPDLIQISDETLVAELQRIGKPIIMKVDFATANLPALFQTLKGNVEYFLLENSDDFGVIDNDVLSQIDAWSFQYPIILGFGVKESNANDLLEQTQLSGLALTGGNEIRPGFGDFDELMNTLEALESDD
ncbi:phosphoribosylanthranilate isomerase [Arcicella aurantiaca]|uniref:Phosphoribosylanthranilate isomerase n=1 Tax=Arcicella aurantiaca TaxID=591202 RepID=A0A316EDY5_9BACT|nr:N-(5'-phosphoribosyl)anthranilate isomerase [Arcicella aurantiaca]PWK29206.1 phosphoribosylanthranilate isomerase [Arcicella aurantiaca]